MKRNVSEISNTVWIRLLDEDPTAREEIILHYQFLVEGVATRVFVKLPDHIQKEELISYGQEGLIKAVDQYDIARGPFKRFASTLIFGAIWDELRIQDWVPRHIRDSIKELAKVEDWFKEESHLDPTEEELAKELDWDTDKVRDIMRRREAANPAHLFDHQDVGDNYTDVSCSTDLILNNWVNVLSKQPQIYQDIITCVYYGGMTLVQTAEFLNRSVTEIRELHNDALRVIVDATISQF